jgi:ADP-ribosylglycohydrolase
MTHTLSEKLEWSLRGAAIGDALGLPVEVQTRESILRLLNGKTHVDSYMRLWGNGFYKKALLWRNDTGDYRPRFRELGISDESIGICSDDTLLTGAIANSLGEKGKIDMVHMFWEHVRIYQSEPFGFGTGTRVALTRIIDGESVNTVSHESFGNGFSMKQSPLAYYFVMRNMSKENMYDTIDQISRVTHAHPIAMTAAQVQNRLLVDLILSPDIDFSLAEWLKSNIDEIRKIESAYSWGNKNLLFTHLMKDLAEDALENFSLEDIYSRYVRKIDDEKRPAFNILSTIGIVYAVFMRDPTFLGLQKAISIGWDTDTYWATIASMIWALRWIFYDQRYWDGI